MQISMKTPTVIGMKMRKDEDACMHEDSSNKHHHVNKHEGL